MLRPPKVARERCNTFVNIRGTAHKRGCIDAAMARPQPNALVFPAGSGMLTVADDFSESMVVRWFG